MGFRSTLVLILAVFFNFGLWNRLVPGQWCFGFGSSLVAGFCLFRYFSRRPALRLGSQLLAALIFFAAVSLGVGTSRAFWLSRPWEASEFLLWLAILAAQILLVAASLVRSGEIAEHGSQLELPRFDHESLPRKIPEPPPLVSIHLACSNEPPELVIKLLDSLSEQNYPNFEVLVLDNNTEDPALWKPIEEHCRRLGSHFRFFSLGNRPGFKAGALNFGLRQTHPEARWVAIVDADWTIDPDWLEGSVPYFVDSGIGSVQGGQAYRDADKNRFKQMIHDECVGPYLMSLAQRDRDNAAPLLGAMGIFDRRTVEEVGGWNEDVICEDIELGLRILNHGKRCLYLGSQRQGRGLLPEDFASYARQRQRWCYGSFSVLRLYRAWLFGKSGNLTPAQRRHFRMEWAYLYGFAFYLPCLILSFLGTLCLVSVPSWRKLPPDTLMASALLLVTLHFFGLIWTFGSRMGIGKIRVFLVLLTKQALIYPVSKAIWWALLRRPLAFHRTDRYRQASSKLQFFNVVGGPWVLGALAVGAMALIFKNFGLSSLHGWLLVLCMACLAFPCLSAIIVNAISEISNRGKDVHENPIPITELAAERGRRRNPMS